MKCIKIKSCDEDNCPYFRRTEIYDYDDKCFCEAMWRDVPQWIVDIHKIEDLAGIFPEWCPLDVMNDE